MLALTTYIKECLPFLWVDCIISYKRGLLFYYYCVGFSRCLNLSNRQLARVFLCLFIMIRGGCWTLRKISC